MKMVISWGLFRSRLHRNIQGKVRCRGFKPCLLRVPTQQGIWYFYSFYLLSLCFSSPGSEPGDFVLYLGFRSDDIVVHWVLLCVPDTSRHYFILTSQRSVAQWGSWFIARRWLEVLTLSTFIVDLGMAFQIFYVGSTMSMFAILLQIYSILQLCVLNTSCFYWYFMLIFIVIVNAPEVSTYDAGRWLKVVSIFGVVYTLCVLNPEFHFVSDSWISINAILYGKRNPIGEIDDISGGFPNWIFKIISRSVNLAFKCLGVCCLSSHVWGNVSFGPGLHTSSFCVVAVYFLVVVWICVIV